MKTNWLWSAWAHLMLAFVIIVNVGWIIFATIFLVPKFQKLAEDGVIDLVAAADDGLSWMPALLDCVYNISQGYGPWIALAAVILVGLFEWRVQSEQKTIMRLSALATMAVGLTVVSVLVGASLAFPHLLSGPVTSRMAVTFAIVQIDHLEASISALEQALRKKDWEAMKEPAVRGSQALYNLDKARPAVRGLWSRQSPSVEEMRANVKDASAAMIDIRQAVINNDAGQMEAGLPKLRQSFAPLREAAKSAR